ncbi:rod shape-determining protein MreD [Pseudophaeobacter sp.]|uniref:rod shape-determining protein MreD n=1 Tax=Pseudophaeobacter sp. TaxID=1971739 RepID=UPI003296D802
MVENTPARILLMRCGFAGLALAVIFFRLLPLDTLPRNWAPPDLLIALTMAWALRRPDYVPVPLVVMVMLMADMLFHRPPGLLTLLVVLGAEFLKSRSQPHQETTFVAEWLLVAMVMTVITLLNRFILSAFAVEQAPLSLSVIEMLATIATYPLVVLFSQGLLGVRKLSPAEAEALGAR